MKTTHLKVFAIASALLIGATAQAETRVAEMWNCTLIEGKTMEQVHAANKGWLNFVNSKVEGGGVRSFVLTSVVGNSQGFVFIDSFPTMSAWVTVKAAIKTPEGQAIDAALTAASKCTANTLHDSTES